MCLWNLDYKERLGTACYRAVRLPLPSIVLLFIGLSMSDVQVDNRLIINTSLPIRSVARYLGCAVVLE